MLGYSGTAGAVEYCLQRWSVLARHVDDGHHPINDKLGETAIRPVALGRMIWLFAGSISAGRRAGATMSLLAVAVAVANGREVHV